MGSEDGGKLEAGEVCSVFWAEDVFGGIQSWTQSASMVAG